MSDWNNVKKLEEEQRERERQRRLEELRERQERLREEARMREVMERQNLEFLKQKMCDELARIRRDKDREGGGH